MGLMTADATAHGGDAGVLRHGLDLGDVSVAHRALHAGLEMRPVRPGDSGGDLINAHPRNGLIGFGKLGKFHDRGPVFGNRGVTHHAGARRRESHLIARIGIGVAGLASEALRDVQFVAERDWLLGRGMGRDVVADFLLRRRTLRCALLRARCEAHHQYDCQHS